MTVIVAAWTRADGRRARSAAAQLGAGAAAVTHRHRRARRPRRRSAAGDAPEVGGYLDFLRLYSVAGFGQLPVPGWSLGYLMGGLSLASLTAICTLAARGRGSELGRPSTIVPLAAVSTFAAVVADLLPGALASQQPDARRAALRRHAGALDGPGLAHLGTRRAIRSQRRAWRWRACAPHCWSHSSCRNWWTRRRTRLSSPPSRSATGGPGLAQRVRALTDLPVISPHTPTRRGARAPQRARWRAAARRRRAGRRDRDADPARPLGRPADRRLPSRTACPLKRTQALVRAARDVALRRLRGRRRTRA